MKRSEPFPIGTKKDYLTVLEVVGWSNSKGWRYRCRCDCGNICKRTHQVLKNNKTTSSCGCKHPQHRSVNVGDKFGKLTVIEEVEPKISSFGRVNRRFRCQCDCGEVDVFLMSRLSQIPHCYKCSQKKPLIHEEIEGEEWRAVVGWEDRYEVSNKGRIRSKDRSVVDRLGRTRIVKGQAMRLQHDKNGYTVFGIKDHGKPYIVKVHRAVAEAFISKVDGKDSVDHINGIKDDNRVENLRWCTTKENVNFPLAKENRRESVRQSYVNNPELRNIRAEQLRKNQSKPCEVFYNGESIGVFYCTIEVSIQIPISPQKVNKMIVDESEYKGYRVVRL